MRRVRKPKDRRKEDNWESSFDWRASWNDASNGIKEMVVHALTFTSNALRMNFKAEVDGHKIKVKGIPFRGGRNNRKKKPKSEK